jgi:hypothetical protein
MRLQLLCAAHWLDVPARARRQGTEGQMFNNIKEEATYHSRWKNIQTNPNVI